VTITRNNT